MAAAPQRSRVRRRDEQCGVAVIDHLWDPPDARGDDGYPGCHRLDDNRGEGLCERRQHEEVGCRKHLGEVVSCAGKDHAVAQPGSFDMRF